jgi:hypothetical protein
MDLSDTIIIEKAKAEQNFAACLMVHSRDINLVGWLEKYDFIDERIGTFFDLVKNGKDVVAASFDVGLQPEILTWGNRDETMIRYHPTFWADRIRQGKYRLNCANTLSKIAKAVNDNNLDQVRRLAVENLIEAIPSDGVVIPTAPDVAIDFIAGLEEENNTIPTNITKIDRAIAGLWRRSELVICARPAVGKTALAWQIARNVSQAGHKVLFFSLEMAQRPLWARAVCGALRIPYRDVLAKRIDEDTKQSIIDTSNQLLEAYGERLLIMDKPRLTTSDMWKLIVEHEPAVVIVDHLRLVGDVWKGENEVKRLGRISQILREIAKEHNLAMIVAAQLNRGLESRSDKRPELSDLRDSGEIEENADFVLGLHRERNYLDQPLEKSPADLIVLKFRDGPANIILHLEFDGLGQWFNCPEFVTRDLNDPDQWDSRKDLQ